MCFGYSFANLITGDTFSTVLFKVAMTWKMHVMLVDPHFTQISDRKHFTVEFLHVTNRTDNRERLFTPAIAFFFFFYV